MQRYSSYMPVFTAWYILLSLFKKDSMIDIELLAARKYDLFVKIECIFCSFAGSRYPLGNFWPFLAILKNFDTAGVILELIHFETTFESI